MTDIFYDCEFIEDGRTIELISIGMVRDDGREYYAVNSEAPWEPIRANDWLVRNVMPCLPLTGRACLDTYLKSSPNSYPKPSIILVGPDLSATCVKPRQVIANEVRDFIQATDDVELWADYGAYDHVVLAQLFGRMIDLPAGIPMWTNDLRQEIARLGNPRLPEQQSGVHNALADARHLRYMAEYLRTIGAAA